MVAASQRRLCSAAEPLATEHMHALLPCRHLSMLMPHTAGQWPEEWGGKWYPDQRGALSSAFQQLLKSDCNK